LRRRTKKKEEEKFAKKRAARMVLIEAAGELFFRVDRWIPKQFCKKYYLLGINLSHRFKS
jgi:hypothetical protein